MPKHMIIEGAKIPVYLIQTKTAKYMKIWIMSSERINTTLTYGYFLLSKSKHLSIIACTKDRFDNSFLLKNK